jgi:NAD(P)-dependent dehydrogenase (short-subunit alcohol dehydrogenase family)
MTGKFAIVTGASSGIGLSLAKELAARGYVLAISSAGDRLTTAAEEFRELAHALSRFNRIWQHATVWNNFGKKSNR